MSFRSRYPEIFMTTFTSILNCIGICPLTAFHPFRHMPPKTRHMPKSDHIRLSKTVHDFLLSALT